MKTYSLDPQHVKDTLLSACKSHDGGPAVFRSPGAVVPPGESPCVHRPAMDPSNEFFVRLSDGQIKNLVDNARLHKLPLPTLMHAFCLKFGVPTAEAEKAPTTGKKTVAVRRPLQLRCRHRGDDVIAAGRLGLDPRRTWVECNRGLGPVGPGGVTCLCDCNQAKCRWYERPESDADLEGD